MFGGQYPIILAPMGGVGTPELAAAVCNAGGIGSLAAAYLTPLQIAEQIDRVRALTDRPFAVNLFIFEAAPLDRDASPTLAVLADFHRELGIAPPALPRIASQDQAEQIRAVLSANVPIFSFTFGIPAPDIVDAFRSTTTKLVGTATTIAEAIALEAAGMDAIVLQGAEAGAHRGTFLGSFEDAMIPLPRLLADATRLVSVPLIAAGGIRAGEQIAALLNQGAAAVQLGTAFIPCIESSAPRVYKDALLAGVKPGDTVVTRAVSGRPARGIPNPLIHEMEKIGESLLPFPWQNAATRPLRNAAALANRAEYLSLWAGEGTGPIRELPAAELVRQLMLEAGIH